VRDQIYELENSLIDFLGIDRHGWSPSLSLNQCGELNLDV
jgi:hypothetical protein